MAEQKHRGPMGGGPRGMMPGEKAKDFKGTMGKLISYLGKYLPAIIAVMLFAIASTVFSIIGPKILGNATTELFNGIIAQLTGTGGIDFEAVADAVVQAAQNYDLRMVGFDPYLGATVMQNIRERLAGTVTEVVEIPQGIRSISPPMKELERLIRAHEMLHVHNTAARQCFLNLRCVSDDNENIKPTKKRSRGRIDITVAWIIAFATAMLQPAPTLADSVAADDWHM